MATTAIPASATDSPAPTSAATTATPSQLAEENAKAKSSERDSRPVIAVLIAICAALIYGHWRMLAVTADTWNQPQYSHGWIVPLIGLFLMWSRRPRPIEEEFLFNGMKMAAGVGGAIAGIGYYLDSSPLMGIGFSTIFLGLLAFVLYGQPFEKVSNRDRWIGLAMITVAMAASSWFGIRLDMMPVVRLSFILTLLGVFLMVGGMRFVAWAGPAVAFLVFMYPLPTVVENTALRSLQKFATTISTAVLQLIGMPAYQDGNIIEIDGIGPLEVAEACSGLRMITIFGAMSFALMLMMKRPWWDRVIILLSALPIALISNITRIVVTALLFKAFPESEFIHKLVHDWAGLAMMPFAMGLLWVEMTLLAMLTMEDEFADPPSSGVAGNPTVTPTPS